MRWPLVGFAYFLIGVAASLGGWLRGVPAWTHPNPWVVLDVGLARATYSGLVGLAIAGVVVMATRAMVGRVGFATRLHAELRPLARSMSIGMVILLSLSSAFGEELLFRGLLQPWIGLIPQAILFGLLHQVGGPSRWVWMGWATLMGIMLGAMYAITGSLVGALLAHALINAVNLSHLKKFDPHREPRRLGGLLSLREHRSR
jgi:membrane protease YdiL (CAAX protease family)